MSCPRSFFLLALSVSLSCVMACSSTPDDNENTGGTGGSESSTTGGSGGMGTGGSGQGGGSSVPSKGCGMSPQDADETYVEIQVTSNGSTTTRQFYISLPAAYDTNVGNRLIVGLHGRDYSGDKMKDYLALEKAPVEARSDEIFVYPDALLRDFGSWGSSIGWQLGPGAADTNAQGDEDVAFIDAMIAYMKDHYCIDNERVFVTGQSWGGDFSSALACLRGDVFRASVPVAANGIYYLESPVVACQGAAAVWEMHGKGDPYFDITLGEEVRDYWVKKNACGTMTTDLGIMLLTGTHEDCVEYSGCSEVVRYCAYDASFGHQVPDDYYAQVTMEFFRSF
ncbi:MAG TPA: prolyl oligopeptidase family serine peptidase [Polyangium sp.]|nr:prolyl oligopeptidase family serine peptidase [Polyangium sp.]